MSSKSDAGRLTYINPDAPHVSAPAYPGERYEALVPATLDLAERAALAVNALTETLDPDYDYELYWIADLLAKQPAMYHTVDDHVQAKFIQALPLVRTACGSTQNLEVERSLMQTCLRMQGADGLLYIPIKGRPWALPPQPNPWAGLDYLPSGDHWCSLAMVGRILGAFCIYARKDPDGPWGDAANRLVAGIKRVTIEERDTAYLFLNCTEPGKPVTKPDAKPVGFRAGVAGWLAQGLAQCHRSACNTDARDLSLKLMRYVMRDSGYFGEEGEFREDFPGVIHFHAHTNQIVAALEVVQATGDQDLLERSLKAYSYAVTRGEARVGFFPEFLSDGETVHTSELCEVADMIAAAVKLSQLGIDKWDDVERWARNQFAECQLVETGWLADGHIEPVDRKKTSLFPAGCDTAQYGTTERVIERAVGSFAGWPGPNDWIPGSGWAIMHCCTGNATRAIYYVWKNILSYAGGTLKINLLLNRASKWADLDSHVPYQGRLEVKIKQDLELAIRLPEWVNPAEARCGVNGHQRRLTFDGRYAQVGSVGAGDAVVFECPIHEHSQRVTIEHRDYTIVRRGNDVVSIDPPGTKGPLYQRGHYRRGETLWRKGTRFVPDEEIEW
jgi:hypothetical protein